VVSSARMKSIWGGGRGAEPAPGATLTPSSSVWCVRRVCWMLVLTCGLPGCAALTFELPSNGGQKCFYEDARKDTVMEATFRVIGNTYDKKLPPVDAEVKSPAGKSVLKVELKTEGRLNFVPSSDGIHSFCFRQHQHGNQAILSLAIRSGERDAISTQIAQKEHLSPLEESILNLARDLESVQIEQRYMRQRERAHRNTNESTNQRVLWWSFVEATALVLVSLVQIFYIKKLFETTRTV